MKKYMVFIWIILILPLSACSKSTAENASPETLYKHDKSIDLLVYNNIAYVNATDIDWAKELELTGDEILGEIQRTGIKKKFKDFDATVLAEGTEVYSVIERADFVLAYVDNKMVPYYAYVEG